MRYRKDTGLGTALRIYIAGGLGLCAVHLGKHRKILCDRLSDGFGYKSRRITPLWLAPATLF